MSKPLHLPVFPRTRGECANLPRPCPFSARCRYGLDLVEHGAQAEAVERRRSFGVDESCALDVADRGPHDFVEIGRIMALTKQRVEQIENVAVRKLVRRGRKLREHI